MKHVPRSLARRLDRLARAAHSFHRFAHHPLCSPYAGEVIRIGRRTRLCRGCTLAALGGASGIAVAVAAPPAPVPALTIALAVLAPLLLFLGAHRPHGRRLSKLFTRAVPFALALGLAASGARAGGAGLSVSGGALASVLAATILYRKRGPDRGPCLSCPERRARTICSGFRAIAAREAAFSRAAGRLIQESGGHRGPPLPSDRSPQVRS